MAWQTPKTNWQAADVVSKDDFNRIEGNIQHLQDTKAAGAVQTALDAHLADNNNPHGVTKTQVGLGNVQNYGIATQAEAEAGTVNNKYMTPLRTLELLNAKGIKIAAGSVRGSSDSTKDIIVGFTPKLVISIRDHTSDIMLYITTTTSFGHRYSSTSGFTIGDRERDFRIISNGFRIPAVTLTHNWVAIG